MWKDIYSAIELDFMIFVIKYDPSYLKLDFAFRNNSFTQPEKAADYRKRQEYIRRFNQSL